MAGTFLIYTFGPIFLMVAVLPALYFVSVKLGVGKRVQKVRPQAARSYCRRAVVFWEWSRSPSECRRPLIVVEILHAPFCHPQTMEAARRVTMEDDGLDDEVEDTFADDLQDATVGAAGSSTTCPEGVRTREQPKQEDEDFGHDSKGLKAFMYAYGLILMFLFFPQTTNVIFTMLRPCRQFISPLPDGSQYMWNDYTIQVTSCWS